MTAELSIRVRGDAVETVRNGLEAAAAERGAELNSSRGHPGDGEISRGEALEELAESYTGWAP